MIAKADKQVVYKQHVKCRHKDKENETGEIKTDKRLAKDERENFLTEYAYEEMC